MAQQGVVKQMQGVCAGVGCGKREKRGFQLNQAVVTSRGGSDLHRHKRPGQA